MLHQLQKLLEQTELELNQQQCQQLVDYVALLTKWNKAYNLTSVRDPEQMLIKHILDSLVVSPYLDGQYFIDVGTGPGLPGIPLAIANPDKEFVLLDSLGKRVRFLRQVIHELNLRNVTAVQSRVENYQPERQFDGVLSRAFASIQEMLLWCRHLPHDDGVYLALKGQLPELELAELSSEFIVKAVYPLKVPSLEGERHLVVIGHQK